MGLGNPCCGCGALGLPPVVAGETSSKKAPQKQGSFLYLHVGQLDACGHEARPLRTHANGYQGGKAAPGTLTSEATKTPPPAVPAGQMRAKQGREAVVLTFLFWKAAHRPRHRESRRLWQKKIRAKRLLWSCRFFA